MIVPRLNSEAVAAIVAADVRGTSKAQMKELYVRRNTLSVDPETSIYRIVPIDHLFPDIRNCRLTHSRISPLVWNEFSENPLLSREYPDRETGGTYTLRGVVENAFGSCWSLAPLDEWHDWAMFSHGRPSVRIESTPGTLLRAVMCEDNPYYELRHAIGKVFYWSTQQLESEFNTASPEKFLDSLGHGIFLSFMQLADRVAGEHEVRLVCDFVPCDPWMGKYMRVEKDLLRVPFDWNDVIRGAVLGPNVKVEDRQSVSEELVSLGATGKIGISAQC